MNQKAGGHRVQGASYLMFCLRSEIHSMLLWHMMNWRTQSFMMTSFKSIYDVMIEYTHHTGFEFHEKQLFLKNIKDYYADKVICIKGLYVAQVILISCVGWDNIAAG